MLTFTHTQHTHFQEFDTDGNGHIDEQELGALLLGLVERGGVSLDAAGGGFTGAEVKRVMGAFDKDGNGTVEEHELVEWIVEGVSKSVQQRRAFARSTPLAAKLDKFLTATARVAVDFAAAAKRRKAWGGRKPAGRGRGTAAASTNSSSSSNGGARLGTTTLTKAQALKAVHAVFEQYDDDESGYLDAKELALLLHQLPMDGGVHMTTPFTPEDVGRVMKAFDEDGDGVLEEEELAHWVIEGMGRDESDRRAFAKTTPLAGKLDEFLTAMIQLATEWCEENSEVLYHPHATKRAGPASSAAKKRLGSTMLTKAQALKAVHAIFGQYDTDESGYLDEDEMAKLLHQLPIDGRVHMAKPFTRKDVKSVMQAFDEDGDGVLEEKELAHWVLEGMGRYQKERRAFARTTELAGKLDEFLTAMIHLATDWCEENDAGLFGPGRKNALSSSHGAAMNRTSRMSAHPGRDDRGSGETWADTMGGMEYELRGDAERMEEELNVFRERIQEIEEKLLSLTLGGGGGRTLGSTTAGLSPITPAGGFHRKHQLLTQRRNAEDVTRIQKLETMVETLCKRLDIRVELGGGDGIGSNQSGKRIAGGGGGGSHRGNRDITQMKRVALPESPAALEDDGDDWRMTIVETDRSDQSGSVHHMSLDTSSEEEEDDGDSDETVYDFEMNFDLDGDGDISVV